jgi:truncated hemoglobin YjbI
MRKCPFDPSSGFATLDARNEYLRHGIDKTAKGDAVDADKPSESLEANQDISTPLYFWQLFSLIGEDPILEILTRFYENVFADTDNPWFRDIFVNRAPMEHHILRQVNYWIDAMGGGACYYGGHPMLDSHHYREALSIMNNRGAKRWMIHMRKAVNEMEFSKDKDPRIKPCFMAFLKTKMKAYSDEFGFEELDNDDFHLEEEDKKE